VTGHVRWLRSGAHASVANINYVQGYILACEDILKDIDSMGPEGSEDYWDARNYIEGQVRESLRQADATLKALQAKT